MSRLTIFLVMHARKHFVGQSSPVLMHHLSYKNAHPRSDAALQMARPLHLCCPPGHAASAAGSLQNMASPHRCTQAQRLHYLPE